MADVETYTVTTDGLALDLLLWRRDRRSTPGLYEQSLRLTPGLAALGPVMPLGTRVTVPLAAKPAEPTVKVVRLWGEA